MFGAGGKQSDGKDSGENAAQKCCSRTATENVKMTLHYCCCLKYAYNFIIHIVCTNQHLCIAMLKLLMSYVCLLAQQRDASSRMVGVCITCLPYKSTQ